MEPFKIGDEVWRVQGNHGEKKGLHAYGPAAVIERASGFTYLLTWPVGHEIQDEQNPTRLFLSEEEAQDVADHEHNAHLERKMRPLASD